MASTRRVRSVMPQWRVVKIVVKIVVADFSLRPKAAWTQPKGCGYIWGYTWDWGVTRLSWFSYPLIVICLTPFPVLFLYCSYWVMVHIFAQIDSGIPFAVISWYINSHPLTGGWGVVLLGKDRKIEKKGGGKVDPGSIKDQVKTREDKGGGQETPR